MSVGLSAHIVFTIILFVLLLQGFQELFQPEHQQLGECDVAQDVEVRVVRHDVGGSGGKGAVHELVVVGVGGDEIPVEIRV